MTVLQRPDFLPTAGPELLVALDVDGTIVGHDGSLSGRVRDAVVELDRRGAHVVLATGRGIVSAAPIAQELALADTRMMVCSNGAVVADVAGRIVDVTTFDPGPVLRALHRELPQALFLVEDRYQRRFVTDYFPPGELQGDLIKRPIHDLIDLEACRVTLRAPGMDSEDMHDVIERAGLQSVQYAVGWTAWLDVGPEGVSKARGLDRVRAELGLDTAHTVAVGDGTNDWEMFDWASWSVAMGQSRPETIARAGAVTGSVQEDGLAEVLESLLD